MMPKPSRQTLTAVFSVLAFLSLLVAGGAIVSAAYQNRALPRSVVSGINVSGKNPQQVYALLVNQAQALAETPISLKLNDKTATVTPTDLGVQINPDIANQPIFPKSGSFNWVQPSFWEAFFKPKQFSLAYALDDVQLQKVLGDKLDVHNTAKDASLTIANGQLTVNSSQSGINIDVAALKNSLEQFLGTAHAQEIDLTYSESAPTITTEAAAAVKTQIDQSLHPVTLSTDTKKITISVADQYNLIDYSTSEHNLTWKISTDKLHSYLQNQVAAKLNVKAVQQVIENNTNRVITAGVNGSQVDINTLQPTVYAAITGQNPNTDPIVVPMKTITFTESHVNPVYTSNLFPGLYLDVSLNTQKITILNADSVIGQFSISSGGWKTPTPIGTFYIFNKIKEAYSPDFKLWMPNWNGLATSPDGKGYLGYGLHAIVCWDKSCTNREGANHIGHPVSHGCIRVDDAGIAFIYNNIPIGTPVVIHQ